MCEYKKNLLKNIENRMKKVTANLRNALTSFTYAFLLYFISSVVFILKTLLIVREINFTTYSGLLVFHVCMEMNETLRLGYFGMI